MSSKSPYEIRVSNSSAIEVSRAKCAKRAREARDANVHLQ